MKGDYRIRLHASRVLVLPDLLEEHESLVLGHPRLIQEVRQRLARPQSVHLGDIDRVCDRGGKQAALSGLRTAQVARVPGEADHGNGGREQQQESQQAIGIRHQRVLWSSPW